jgi:hypothetical protein
MMDDLATLETLVAELRANADTDIEFAQRVAMACCALVETKVDAVAAIRATFRIQ